MNLICKLIGHKWRDTSYWEFKRISGKKMKRNIVRIECRRCGELYPLSVGASVGVWQPDE